MGFSQPPTTPADSVRTAEEIRQDKLKKARQQYQKMRASEKEKDERYFRSITTGKSWKIFKALAIYSALFSILLSLDFFLTRDFESIDHVRPYIHLPNMIECKGELFEIQEDSYWASDWRPTRANYSYFFHDLKSVSILIDTVFTETKLPQDRTKKFELFQNFRSIELYSYASVYYAFPFLHIFLFLPLFLLYYKRPTINFAIARLVAIWVIYPVVIILSCSNGRIFHLFGLL